MIVVFAEGEKAGAAAGVTQPLPRFVLVLSGWGGCVLHGKAVHLAVR